MALENAGGFTMHLLQGHLTFWVYCSILPCPGGGQDLDLALLLGCHHVDGKANHVLGKRAAVQFHLVIKLEMSLLDGFLDPHPEDPAVIDGVRIPVMETAVTFLLYSIGPKHGMSFRQLDSAFLHQELKQLISFRS
jgi:hypothetical protein